MKNEPREMDGMRDASVLNKGFSIEFVTMSHNSPPHRHRTMEILYILNGHADITIEGKEYHLDPLDYIVADSLKVHSVIFGLPQTMGISIQISKNHMRQYLPDIELRQFDCYSKELPGETGPGKASRLSEYMKDLTIYYMSPGSSYNLRCTGLVFHILAELVEKFSRPVTEGVSVNKYEDVNRIEKICSYVESHYRENISLEDAAAEQGLSREYFCRYFKANMGISFLNYVNQVRMNHVYHNLIQTDEAIQDIMEKHGFYNQKLFYRKFRELYGCTPRMLRKITKDNLLLSGHHSSL